MTFEARFGTMSGLRVFAVLASDPVMVWRAATIARASGLARNTVSGALTHLQMRGLVDQVESGYSMKPTAFANATKRFLKNLPLE